MKYIIIIIDEQKLTNGDSDFFKHYTIPMISGEGEWNSNLRKRDLLYFYENKVVSSVWCWQTSKSLLSMLDIDTGVINYKYRSNPKFTRLLLLRNLSAKIELELLRVFALVLVFALVFALVFVRVRVRVVGWSL